LGICVKCCRVVDQTRYFHETKARAALRAINAFALQQINTLLALQQPNDQTNHVCCDMTALKSVNKLLRCQLLFLLIFRWNEALAWQQSCDGRRQRHSKSCDDRRQFLGGIARMASAAAVSTAVILPTQQSIAAIESSGISADSARKQWKDAALALDNLIQDWPTFAAKGGDGIRGVLGTQGTSSPLFQIDKAFRALRDSDYVEDFVEFQEIAEEFGLALARADSMAYSANFAGGSGKPTPPAVYIEKSKTEVVEMQRIAKKLDAMVK